MLDVLLVVFHLVLKQVVCFPLVKGLRANWVIMSVCGFRCLREMSGMARGTCDNLSLQCNLKLVVVSEGVLEAH